MKPHRGYFINAGTLAVLFSMALWALVALHSLNRELVRTQEDDIEVLYLPSGPGLEFISFGYRNVLAHLLWFKTISYFGKHYASDRNYTWLSHMCGLVSTLSPRALYTYQFCSNMLSWEANVPEQSVALLTKGITHSPDDWHLYYYRGITYLYFLKSTEKAKDDFVRASRLPGVPVLVKSLAAKTLTDLNDPSSATTLLETLISEERDPSARKALLQRLERLRKEGVGR